MYELDFSILLSSMDNILNGIGITFIICAVSSVLAFLIGSILFFFRWYRLKILQKIVSALVAFIRNTPLLVQIYIFYKGLPQVGLVLPPIWCAIFALSLYTGVYISEAIRSGHNAIKPQQKNAALALGLNDWQTFVYVVYPQSLRYAILPLGSQFINLIKNSTLASFIAITDIFYVVSKGVSDYFRVIEFFLLGVALYATATITVAILTNFIYIKFRLKSMGRA